MESANNPWRSVETGVTAYPVAMVRTFSVEHYDRHGAKFVDDVLGVSVIIVLMGDLATPKCILIVDHAANPGCSSTNCIDVIMAEIAGSMGDLRYLRGCQVVQRDSEGLYDHVLASFNAVNSRFQSVDVMFKPLNVGLFCRDERAFMEQVGKRAGNLCLSILNSEQTRLAEFA